MINRAVAPDHLDDTVAEMISMVVRGGPEALAAAKELINRVPEMELKAAFEWTTVRSRELFVSDEAKAGIAAFNARADAPWVPK